MKVFKSALFLLLVVACLADIWMFSLPSNLRAPRWFLAFVFLLKFQYLVREWWHRDLEG
jgi:hypothetical protein